MTVRHSRRRIWGWFFFDWASQPYNTLLITFIFAPYVQDVVITGHNKSYVGALVFPDWQHCRELVPAGREIKLLPWEGGV